MSSLNAENAQHSETWFHRGFASITRMGRSVPSSATSGRNPLRAVFTDLMAYVVFLQSSAGQEPIPSAEVRQKIVGLINLQEERAKAGGIAVESYREACFAV